jgi:hypothetical protein
MKCRDCGQEFPNLNALTQHKAECPALISEQEPKLDLELEQPEPEQNSPQNEARDAPLLIPIELCPEETKLYAQGQTVALKVGGLLTPEGILVQEVTLIR